MIILGFTIDQKDFGACCIQKILLTEDISNDKITQEDESFLVKNSTSGETHRVSFGSDEVLPSCSCYDWEKNLMLCKHIMAAMPNCKDITWESFAPTSCVLQFQIFQKRR